MLRKTLLLALALSPSVAFAEDKLPADAPKTNHVAIFSLGANLIETDTIFKGGDNRMLWSFMRASADADAFIQKGHAVVMVNAGAGFHALGSLRGGTLDLDTTVGATSQSRGLGIYAAGGGGVHLETRRTGSYQLLPMLAGDVGGYSSNDSKEKIKSTEFARESMIFTGSAEAGALVASENVLVSLGARGEVGAASDSRLSDNKALALRTAVMGKARIAAKHTTGTGAMDYGVYADVAGGLEDLNGNLSHFLDASANINLKHVYLGPYVSLRTFKCPNNGTAEACPTELVSGLRFGGSWGVAKAPAQPIAGSAQ